MVQPVTPAGDQVYGLRVYMYRWTEREREVHREREGGTHRGRERQRARGREGQRKRVKETDRQGQRGTDTDTETDGQRAQNYSPSMYWFYTNFI